MKVLLMHPDHDFDVHQTLPPHAGVIAGDLGLDAVVDAMAAGDALVSEVARVALLCAGSTDERTLGHRQAATADCVRNAAAVRALYACAIEGHEARRKEYFGVFTKYPSSIIFTARTLLGRLVTSLRQLRGLCAAHASGFSSDGFTRLFSMIASELDESYLASVEARLSELEADDAVVIGMRFGEGLAGEGYVLRKVEKPRRAWLARLTGGASSKLTYELPERDESGASYLGALRDRAINDVANALAQATDHVIAFFGALRTELAFYVGSINLKETLDALGAPTCFAEVSQARGVRCAGLYDVGLALAAGKRLVGNVLDATGKDVVVITGANQGGKSTFLRALGLAQLMMQSGLFVGAERFASDVREGIFTHFKRPEDEALKHGKLDEELARMANVASAMTSRSLVLFNESFSSTNEREGSEIAGQIVRALSEAGARIVFVTHFHLLARDLFDTRTAFLRAERSGDGTRTYVLAPGEPLATSFGGDVYREVFGESL